MGHLHTSTSVTTSPPKTDTKGVRVYNTTISPPHLRQGEWSGATRSGVMLKKKHCYQPPHWKSSYCTQIREKAPKISQQLVLNHRNRQHRSSAPQEVAHHSGALDTQLGAPMTPRLNVDSPDWRNMLRTQTCIWMPSDQHVSWCKRAPLCALV